MFHFLSCLHRSVSPFPLQFLLSSSCTAGAPDSDLSTSSLGFTGSLAHCQVQRGFNSGGDEIGSACCSSRSAPAKVVSVSCQLILCQSSSTSRSDRLPSHCPCPHLFISAPSLHPHVQFIYFLMPLPFASLLGLLCLLHHKVRSSAFEMLRKLAHRAPVDLFEENKRRLPPKKKILIKVGLSCPGGPRLMLMSCPSASHGAYDC